MEDFWIYNYSTLWKNKYSIFPKQNMSKNEILNSFTRFSLLLIIIFIFIKSNYFWYLIPGFLLIGSFILGLHKDKIIKKNNKIDLKKRCRLPIIDNPYMNVLANQSNIRLPSCNFNENKDKINKFYKFNLYQNSTDIFDNKHLERQFYTMPITTIPNDTKKFSSWLYKPESTCKSDGERCLQYEDERYH